ncbi:MAG: nucleotidyltransferase domain-containing protein [Chitinophagaceae bacterium]|nr:nucleotidyltransferase domain-containing protein [Chitinophagaceae bacterium]
MDTIISIFRKYSEIREVIIFGSRAKGTFKHGSDLDFAIRDSDISESTLSHLQSDFSESSLPYHVDLIDQSKLVDLDLIEHIHRVGKLFYKSK